MNTNTDFIIHESAENYHFRSRSGEYMSSHLLADFRESPSLYYKEISGQIDLKESAAFTLGRAAHSLILEGRHAFDRDYIVCNGPVNPRTGEPFGKTTKAYADWLEEQDREVISEKDFGFIMKLQAAVCVHPEAVKLLAKGEAEGVVRACCCGVPCQIRLDWFNPDYGIVDLKTCDALRWFESDCRRYGYIHQMAFYRMVLRAVSGTTFPVYMIAVEKNEPFSAGVWKLTDEVLDLAEKTNKAALNRYRECDNSGIWPTGFEEIRIIDTL